VRLRARLAKVLDLQKTKALALDCKREQDAESQGYTLPPEGLLVKYFITLLSIRTTGGALLNEKKELDAGVSDEACSAKKSR